MDDRRFDTLSRRIGALTRPRLPRRTLLTTLGGASLAGALGLMLDTDATEAKKNNTKKKKCKKEGSRCDKQKCKKQDKKCCCKDLICNNDVCEGKGGSCPTTVDNDLSWGTSGTAPSQFNSPYGITTDPSGNVYVTDTGNERVQVFNANGGFSDEWGQEGFDDGEFQTPLGIGFGEDSGGAQRVYVTDPDQNSASRKYRKFRTNGDVVASGNIGNVTGFSNPAGVAVDSDQNTWVVDTSGLVFLFDDDGDLVTSWEPGGSGSLSQPEGIGIFEENNRTFVYVADTGNDRVVKFEYVDNSASGLVFLDAAGSTGSSNDRFNDPVGIAVDDCGNLWVADRINDRIQQLDKNLSFESRFTNSFDRPTGVALSPNGKSLYVVDSDNNRVVKFALS